MGRWLCELFVCVLTFPLLSQSTSSKGEVATVTAVNVHHNNVEGSSDKSYDVSLRVGNTVYVVLYTPPSGANGVEYSVGMDVVVLVGNKTITFTKLGRTSEVPILRRETLPAKAGFDSSRAPSEYFSQKLQHLSEKLDLSPDQQAKIKPILEQEAGEAGQLTSNPVLSSEDKLNKLEKIVRSSDQKLKPILTADQWQTLQNMRKEQKRELKESIAEKPKAQ